MSLIWIGLLGAIQFTDIITTAIGRTRGAVEAMPISAAVMNEGGLMLFVSVKLTLVLAGAAAVFLPFAGCAPIGQGQSHSTCSPWPPSVAAPSRLRL